MKGFIAVPVAIISIAALVPFVLFLFALALGAVIICTVAFGIRSMISAHRRWYWRSVERARRHIEFDARRFNGTVRWNDEQ